MMFANVMGDPTTRESGIYFLFGTVEHVEQCDPSDKLGTAMISPRRSCFSEWLHKWTTRDVLRPRVLLYDWSKHPLVYLAFFFSKLLSFALLVTMH